MARNTQNPTADAGTAFSAPLAPQGLKGGAWTFKQFCTACDTPGAKSVQAVLAASNNIGFSLYARQDRRLHRITLNDRFVIFRTIEQALDTLSDVPHLAPEIAIDTTNW
ncbi:hypothetical protein [Acidovorax sp.]|uniref:hypothetical protein n=1 Tax=Acidovorax sp. TaxID=1872122 RepID=UPI00262E39AB|nr:hypothetical protein [Acidovorax sp.]